MTPVSNQLGNIQFLLNISPTGAVYLGAVPKARIL